MLNRWKIVATICFCASAVLACSGEPEKKDSAPAARVVPTAWTPELIHTALLAKNPEYNGGAQFRIDAGLVVGLQLSGTNVTDLSALDGMEIRGLDLRGVAIDDISALKGQPLTELFLEDTRVADLTPLKGKQLVSLYLGRTAVTDLDPLRGMPLSTLNLLGTSVRDLSPLNGMPLKYLWLNETPVQDISPLSRCPLVSLTLHRTPVADLSPLAGVKTLERLHAGETQVTDLTPIVGLPLNRLIFTPERIRRGLENVRAMTSLRELGPSFEERHSPADFWRMFDAETAGSGQE